MEIGHGMQRRVVGAGATYGVVGLGCGSVQHPRSRWRRAVEIAQHRSSPRSWKTCMRWSSSITTVHSSADSSSGSRRPDEDRQRTHARLQAHVSSQVRQIGAANPCWNRSASFIGAPFADRVRAVASP